MCTVNSRTKAGSLSHKRSGELTKTQRQFDWSVLTAELVPVGLDLDLACVPMFRLPNVRRLSKALDLLQFFFVTRTVISQMAERRPVKSISEVWSWAELVKLTQTYLAHLSLVL